MVNSIDLIIVFVYILLLFGVGIFVGLRENVEDFLILSRKAKFPMVLFSIVSTWVGVGVIVGTSASGYDTGISLGITALSGGLVGVIAAAVFAPTVKRFGDRFNAHTIGDFFIIRYSRSSQIIAGGIIALIYMAFTAAQFVGLAALLSVWTGIGFETVVILAALTTIVYTAFAGIKSDFYTDAIHFWVMLIVLFGVLLPIVWQTSGGVVALSKLPPSYFDPFAYGGISFFLAALIFGAGVVFVSMEVWQRIYASSSEKTARWALASSVAIILAFYLLAMYLGMVAKVIEPNLANRDLALFTLMKKFLSPGILGLGIAAFLAVFISTVNTMIMVVSATLTKDFYKGIINPKASDKQLLKVGRFLTLVVGLLGFLLAFQVRDIVTLTVGALLMLQVLLPAIMGGFFWRKATAKAAFWSILLGFIVAVALLPSMPQTAFLPGFVVSLIVFVGVSLITKHSPSENIKLLN